MIGALMALSLMAGGTLLEIQLLPWTPDKSICFAADSNLDGQAEICVLQERTLSIYGRLADSPLHRIALPEGTSAIDIADIDRDGTADLVAVWGEQILRYRLVRGKEATPDSLFSHTSQFSQADGYPFPTVLIVEREGGPRIALPTADALEVRHMNGQLADAYPIGINAPYHVSIGRPFSYGVNQHAQLGPPEALEFRVSRVASYKPLLPDDAFPIDVADPPTQRFGLGRPQWEASIHKPESWPWFEIARTGSGSVRGLYRKSDTNPDATLIRVRTLSVEPDMGSGDIMGPARLYPGTLLLHPETSPDFSGDGYTDLMLWKSPRPGLSADSVARAAASKRWPLTITTHIYLPEKQRFEPKPQAAVSLEIPLAWFLSPASQGPLQVVLLRDFNGDHKTDFGCLTAEDTLTVWQAGESGLNPSPVFEERFPAKVDEILFEIDLEGKGATSIVLRCGNYLAVLRPRSFAPAG
jgi:hypothetical protein